MQTRDSWSIRDTRIARKGPSQRSPVLPAWGSTGEVRSRPEWIGLGRPKVAHPGIGQSQGANGRFAGTQISAIIRDSWMRIVVIVRDGENLGIDS